MLYFNVPGVGLLAPGTPFTLNEIKYPPNWLELATPDYLAALSIETEEVAEEPGPPTSLEEARQIAVARAWEECERRLESGSVTVTIDEQPHSFGTDRETRENIGGIVNAINAERGGLLPPGTVPSPRLFAPKGEALTEFSHEGLAAIGAAVLYGKDIHMAAYFVHKGAISALATVDDALEYDVTTGWPS